MIPWLSRFESSSIGRIHVSAASDRGCASFPGWVKGGVPSIPTGGPPTHLDSLNIPCRRSTRGDPSRFHTYRTYPPSLSYRWSTYSSRLIEYLGSLAKKEGKTESRCSSFKSEHHQLILIEYIGSPLLVLHPSVTGLVREDEKGALGERLFWSKELVVMIVSSMTLRRDLLSRMIYMRYRSIEDMNQDSIDTRKRILWTWIHFYTRILMQII